MFKYSCFLPYSIQTRRADIPSRRPNVCPHPAVIEQNHESGLAKDALEQITSDIASRLAATELTKQILG